MDNSKITSPHIKSKSCLVHLTTKRVATEDDEKRQLATTDLAIKLCHDLSQPLKVEGQYLKIELDKSEQHARGFSLKFHRNNMHTVKTWMEETLCTNEKELPKPRQITQSEFYHVFTNSKSKLSFKPHVNIDKALDSLIQNLVVAARPVADYSASFFVPLEIKPGTENPEKVLKSLQAQLSIQNKITATSAAQNYFKAWQNLAPKTLPLSFAGHQLHSWKLPNEGKQIVHIKHGNYADDESIQLDIQGLNLHMMIDDVIMLELEVGSHEFIAGLSSNDALNAEDQLITDKVLAAKAPILWKRFLNSDYREWLDSPKRMSFAMLLDALAEIRHTHVPHIRKSRGKFTEITLRNSDDKIIARTEMGPAANFEIGIFGELFKTALPLIHQNFTPLYDERALGFTSVILEGSPPQGHAIDPLRHRLAELDPYGTYYSYDSEFSKNDLGAISYDRFSGFGTYYTANSHSFTHLGFQGGHNGFDGDDQEKRRDELRKMFGWRFVHLVHMPNLYKRMFLLTLFQDSKLLQFSAALTSQNVEKPGRLSQLRAEFLRFKTHLYPQRVSTQIQGHELHQHIEKAMNIPHEIEHINQRLSEHELFISLKSSAKENTRRSLMYYAGLPLASTFLLLKFGSDPFLKWWEHAPFAKGVARLDFVQLYNLKGGLFVYLIWLAIPLTWGFAHICLSLASGWGGNWRRIWPNLLKPKWRNIAGLLLLISWILLH